MWSLVIIISCSVTVDFAKEEGYIVIKQLVSVHCSFLYFEIVSTITEYKSLSKCCMLSDIRTETCRGGGTPHMKGVGMLVGTFELNP